MKLGIRFIGDVINQQGELLFFLQASRIYVLGMHHRPIWRTLCSLLQPLLPIPPLVTDILAHWILQPHAPGPQLNSLTLIKVYRQLLPAPWIAQHANALWHLQKSLC